jgi:hypothetical protein
LFFDQCRFVGVEESANLRSVAAGFLRLRCGMVLAGSMPIWRIGLPAACGLVSAPGRMQALSDYYGLIDGCGATLR